IASIINAFPNRKLLRYSYLEQIKDIAPAFLLAAAMGVIVHFLPIGFMPDVLELIVQIIAGAIIYIGGAILLKLESAEYVRNVVTHFLKKKKEA
nr:polysaccharide biosynthesis C-terminal domain-containing protein [Lachnospiraceae bacterium]